MSAQYSQNDDDLPNALLRKMLQRKKSFLHRDIDEPSSVSKQSELLNMHNMARDSDETHLQKDFRIAEEILGESVNPSCHYLAEAFDENARKKIAEVHGIINAAHKEFTKDHPIMKIVLSGLQYACDEMGLVVGNMHKRLGEAAKIAKKDAALETDDIIHVNSALTCEAQMCAEMLHDSLMHELLTLKKFFKQKETER